MRRPVTIDWNCNFWLLMAPRRCLTHRTKCATLVVQLPAAQTLTVTWPDLALTRIRHAPQLAPGQTLIVDLTATGQVGDTTKFSLRLVDPAGKTWAQQDKASAPDLRFELALPRRTVRRLRDPDRCLRRYNRRTVRRSRGAVADHTVDGKRGAVRREQ